MLKRANGLYMIARPFQQRLSSVF